MVSISAQSMSCSDCSQPEGPGWQSLSLSDNKLFGTDGIRGKAGELLNAPFTVQIGYWAGCVLQHQYGSAKGPVLLGQDSRNSGHMLASALAAGLTSAGLEVWNLGLCPTAAVANLTSRLGAIAGVMISASHNPPEDNGIKFFGPQGTKLPMPVQQQIEQALRGSPVSMLSASSGWGQWHNRPELVEQYLDFLHQPLPNLNLAGLKVVLDMAWGAAAGIANRAFGDTAAEVVGIHGLPDGDRINVNCGSTHLEPLQAAVREHQADIGFAFDGDADRVIAVDGQGRVVDGDYILYFWGKTLKAAQRLPENLIVSTVMANLGFERAWTALGGSLLRTKVGDQHVHAEMVGRGAKLGGEQSGHILCHHYSLTGDGILTALHLADLVQQVGGSLAALVDQSFTTYPQRLENVRVKDSDRRKNWHSCGAVTQAIAQAKADMGDLGRVLVRPSGTEPLIRVMVEAQQQPLVDHWTDHIATAVRANLAV
ncbi:MAG: phosphoglucosamine mutase [Cyanobacteria bacterium P01_C01_bin.120]